MLTPLSRARTPEGRWSIAVLERLSLKQLLSLNEATRDARSDDEYIAAMKKWTEKQAAL
jgi:hypothetical protein